MKKSSDPMAISTLKMAAFGFGTKNVLVRSSEIYNKCQNTQIYSCFLLKKG